MFGFIGTALLLSCCCYICCPKCLSLVNPFRPCALINQTFNVCCTKNRSHRITSRTTEDLSEEGIELSPIKKRKGEEKLHHVQKTQ